MITLIGSVLLGFLYLTVTFAFGKILTKKSEQRCRFNKRYRMHGGGCIHWWWYVNSFAWPVVVPIAFVVWVGYMIILLPWKAGMKIGDYAENWEWVR